MAKTLLITTTDIKQFTIVDGNVNNDKFIQFIEIAQAIHIQNVIGTDLYEKLQSEITGATLTGAYETLVETYIKPALIYWALYEYLPFAPYTVGNKGIFKHTSEAAVVADKDEVHEMREASQKTANYYTTRLLSYLCANETSFPEYKTNTDGDVYPAGDINYGNWFL